jgi:MtrB/PioB family decaheme-associated outer membrane protein
MTTMKIPMIMLVTLLLVPSAIFGQTDKQSTDQHGSVEFGVRHVWGDVYGRPDLPFTPDLFTSKLNEYSDLRNEFFIRRFQLRMDDVFGTKNFLRLQSASTLYKNQSYLATIGQYNRFKLQFRFDQIPHTFTNTARTLFTESSPGVYTLPLIVKNGLKVASSTGTAAQIARTLPSYIATQLVPNEAPFLPALTRKTVTGLANVDVTSSWNLAFQYSREKEFGTRPIGLIFNSGPSASASSSPGTVPNLQSPGTGVEAPEPIDYVNNTVKVLSEYAKKDWGLQLGYTGSIFQDKIKSLVIDNPFATADVPVRIIVPGGGCTPTAPALNCAVSAIPARGLMALYPDNQAHYINFAGAFDLAKHVRVMGTVNPGWLRQNDPFFPYTSNTAITGIAPPPATSLNGSKQTLAMNWTAVSQIKNLELTVKYRQYDYNNNTPEREFTPIVGDVIAANPTATGQAGTADLPVRESLPYGYNRKTLELSGNWFFAKRSSINVGYEAEWMDREHRDAEHSLEHSVFSAIDYSPTRDLLFRVGYRHSDRKPEAYVDEESLVNNNGIPADHPNARRFDEAARLLNRIDTLAQYTKDKFSISGSFQTVQNDFNRPLSVNSTTPLNFLTGAAATTAPYYLYGALKDISFIYTFDADYALSNEVSFFVEYTHERYHKRMISRNRAPGGAGNISLGCGTGQACDTANNDWESTYRDLFHTYAAGFDLNPGKKLYVSTYYSLSDGTGNVFSRALGDPTITSGANKFTNTGTSAAQDYPQTTTRIHELAVVFKYKLTENLMPKLEYRYQQFDNKDYQTSPMTPYMGCIGAGSVVVSAPCINVGSTVASQFPSPFYPGFVVGDTSAARYLFLGADQPSYHAHILSGTMEYRF